MTAPAPNPRLDALLDGFEATSAAILAVKAVATTLDALVDAHPLLASPEPLTSALREMVAVLAERAGAADTIHQRECGLIHAMRVTA